MSAFCHTFSSAIDQYNLILIYLVSVILAALYLGEGPTLLVVLVSFSMLDFGILNPTLDWGHYDEQYITLLGIFLFVAFIISNLANRLRRQAQQAKQEESHTRALYELSKELAQKDDTKDITESFQRHLGRAYDLDVHVYLKTDSGIKESASGRIKGRAETIASYIAPEERVALEQSLREGCPTGRGSAIHPYLNASFYPLVTARGVIGVVRLASRPGTSRPDEAVNPERDDASRLLFQSFCNQVALALEQVVVSEQARRAEIRAETERLQSALLNSISHDLQTPLASISGSLQLLTNREKLPDENTQQTLLNLAADQTQRLRRLVTNLLQITRIEGGGLRLNLQTMDADELLDLILNQAPQAWKDRVVIHAPPEYLEFNVDGVLLLSVLLNLLENAAKYSPSDQPIEIEAVKGKEETVQFRVLDRGAGVPPDFKEKVFERFFRMETHLRAVGSGLGLYVSKGIIEAHGGELWVEDRPGGGSIFVVQLPAEVDQDESGNLNPDPAVSVSYT
jgi:two-component system sensor histidine kinase KdpD